MEPSEQIYDALARILEDEQFADAVLFGIENADPVDLQQLQIGIQRLLYPDTLESLS